MKPVYDLFLSEIKTAFEQIGVTSQITGSESFEKLRDEIRNYKPDFLFCISIFILLSEIGKITNTPVIYLELDKIMNSEFFDEKNFNNRDYIFSTYKADTAAYNKLKMNAWYLPAAFNIKRHKFIERHYKYDTTFVGSIISEKNNSFREYFNAVRKQIQNSTDLLNKYDMFVQIIENILNIQEEASKKNTYILPELIEQLNLAFFDKKRMRTLLAKESAHRHRVLYLKKIDNLSVFGNNDWKNIDWPNIKYYGSVEQYTQVSEIFYQSKINIDITRIYALDGFSDRIPNVLYSNGFLIANRTDSLLEIFEDKKEIVTFSNIDELQDLIKYYLKHDSEREKIALNGYEKIINEHSFVNKVNFILQAILKRN